MKRKEYNITLHGAMVNSGLKYSFNSARRLIPVLIKETGNVGQVWELFKEEQTRDGVNIVKTVQAWKERATGAVCIATVELKD